MSAPLVFPRYQHAYFDGQFQERMVRSPEELNPDVWKESPADCDFPGKVKPEPDEAEAAGETPETPAAPGAPGAPAKNRGGRPKKAKPE